MNTRYALVALLSLVPATLFAADKAPSTKTVSADVAPQTSDDTAPSTPAVKIPDYVQAVNFDGSTAFPPITANDWNVFQDAASVGTLAADGFMLADLNKNGIIDGHDYQLLMDRMAAAYAWQNSVIAQIKSLPATH